MRLPLWLAACPDRSRRASRVGRSTRVRACGRAGRGRQRPVRGARHRRPRGRRAPRGVQRRRAGPRIGADAICLLASITKPIVATAVMREVEAGRLGPRRAARGVAPGAGRAGAAPYTAWHVLTHTSGIGDMDIEALLAGGRRAGTSSSAAHGAPAGDDARVALPLRHDALRPPRRGSRPARSGGRSSDLLRDNVLDPLGMVDTGFDPEPDTAARVAPVVVGAGAGGRPLRDRHSVAALHRGCVWPAVACGARRGRPPLRPRDAPRR